MISLHQIAQECGLNDEEVAKALELSDALREIGLENYLVNPPMEHYYRELLSARRNTRMKS